MNREPGWFLAELRMVWWQQIIDCERWRIYLTRLENEREYVAYVYKRILKEYEKNAKQAKEFLDITC